MNRDYQCVYYPHLGFHLSIKVFINCMRVVRGYWRLPYLSVRSSHKCSKGINLDCMVANPFGRCDCLSQKLDKFRLHIADNCLHCLIGNLLGAWAVSDALRRNRRAWVRGGPTYERWALGLPSRNRFRTIFGQNTSTMTAYGIKGNFGGS